MIEVRAVSKAYGSIRALQEVSLQAPDGAVTGFVGPNGAGKSTLLRIVASLTVADQGTVTIDGQDWTRSPRPGSALGVFLSAEGIPGHLKAGSFLAHVCDMQGLPGRRVGEVLEAVGLESARDRKVKTFSLGMRQRLGIAAAIAGGPRNLMLDEPINGLDPDGILWLRRYVRAVADAGGTVLLSSHHMNELSQVADHVVMIDKGQVIRSGPVASFVAEEQHRTYFESDDLAAAIALLRGHGLDCQEHADGAVVLDALPQQVGRLLFNGGPEASLLRRVERTIEQTYFDEIAQRQRVEV